MSDYTEMLERANRTPKKTYLGDGLYAHDDGYHFWLTAPRIGGDHEVALDHEVFQEFMCFVERTRNVTIKITPNKQKGEP